MAVTLDLLAAGVLGEAAETLYVAPGGATAVVKTLTCFNAGAADETVTLAVIPAGGAARTLTAQALGAGYTLVLDAPLTLGAGDALSGHADHAGAVDFTISGLVRGETAPIGGAGGLTLVAADPPAGSPGEVILNTTTHQVKTWYDGAWQVLHTLVMTDKLLLETGDVLLAEDGRLLIREA